MQGKQALYYWATLPDRNNYTEGHFQYIDSTTIFQNFILCADDLRGLKSVSNLLQLESQVVVSHLTWVLGFKLQSFGWQKVLLTTESSLLPCSIHVYIPFPILRKNGGRGYLDHGTKTLTKTLGPLCAAQLISALVIAWRLEYDLDCPTLSTGRLHEENLSAMYTVRTWPTGVYSSCPQKLQQLILAGLSPRIASLFHFPRKSEFYVKSPNLKTLDQISKEKKSY